MTQLGNLPAALNTEQASRYTGLATATLEKLRCTGGGPPFVSYSRRAIRYRLADLDAWMTARTRCSTSELERPDAHGARRAV
ncbi:helix-turn-helix transcriptional regulator [Sphingomonas endolithica]|uniref:helix-turn-helix transcriptional regulator n=1 Tax=Sphingomonas endolithica TaxID=2972485 RepID=UPI0021AECD80|nr:helix-turn-helix domain-containing protein [Sphingomonas sp. ZFBP2030]